MCDTFGTIRKNKCLFAKNSDRSANEPQVMQFIPRTKHTDKSVKLTYITIDQVPETNAILISRPTWLWGAEMGVNEFGVCIGNEAIFTIRKDKDKKSLIGMDLVRLALERSKSAKEAVDIICELVSKHNQCGNCAFDHKFLYDNSFLIMDFNEIYILETHGDKFYFEKREKCESISNRYILKHSFKENVFVRHFSGARKRRSQTSDELYKLNSALECFEKLREHDTISPKNGTVSSVCMHEGGLVGDHTTNSMVVELDKSTKEISVYFTGCSTPCQSIFKYWKFGDSIHYPICSEKIDNSYWLKREKYFRSKMDYELDSDFNKIEKRIVQGKIGLEESLELEADFYKSSNWEKIKLSPIAKHHWNSKNKSLGAKT